MLSGEPPDAEEHELGERLAFFAVRRLVGAQYAARVGRLVPGVGRIR